MWTEAVSHIRKNVGDSKFKIIRALQNKQNQKSLSSDEWDLRISILMCVLYCNKLLKFQKLQANMELSDVSTTREWEVYSGKNIFTGYSPKFG